MSTGSPLNTVTKDPKEYRLPTNVQPTHYDITVRTDLEKLTFDGFVTVHLHVNEDTSNIVFNTAHLELGELTLFSPALQRPEVRSASELTIDETQERASLHLSSTLPGGSKAQLKVSFVGELSDSMMGYYRAAWEHEGKTKHYSLTQFQPTAARHAFPCWDEPLLKATFSITLISRDNTVALSNMPAVAENKYDPNAEYKGGVISWLTSKLSAVPKTDGPWKITEFAMTPPMSTYVVAFANGPFVYLESSYKSPLSGATRPLRIYTTPDLIHQAQFALDVKRDVLPHYEQVFDIEYPLPKLDTFVVTDFDAGAMENWGLITGRTSAFLLDPKKSDVRAKKDVASTQSHEVAHMWFGNITTMKWWDNLYLNEGFASLMGEVIILDKIFPEWKVHAEFLSVHLNKALSLDAKLSSHPIEVDCPDANMINQIFDPLSYAKAASVLRMLSRYVGEEDFLKGVSLYLKEHRFGNTVTNDLWEGIGKATGVDISKVMGNWISKMGFPVVTVTETKDGVLVRQDRFLETGPAPPEHNETLWTIPLSLLTVSADGKANIDTKIILDSRETTISLDTSKPFKINAGTTGVYRVLYATERLDKIAEEAAKANSIFSLEDRMGLLMDAPALAQAGYVKTSSSLSLINKLREEKEYLVLKCLADSLEEVVSTWWEDVDVTEKLNAFSRKLFVPIVKRLGYDYPDCESVDDSLLRTRAVTVAALAGDNGTIEELKSRFSHFMKTADSSQIPADLERVVFRIAVKYGGRAEYDAVKAIAVKPSTPSTGIAAIIGMCATLSDELAEETFDHMLTKARDQDLVYMFYGFRVNDKYAKFSARKFRENFDVFVERSGLFGLAFPIKYSHDILSTKEDYEEIAKFFKTKDTSKFNMALQQTYDTILARAAWIQRSTADISEWLDSKAARE
ncbi:hypothetical protein EUX98_g6135 [Antrodiella citrinella]|uniref:Aminopeptidase n=1 Tax=Antrodiella citrinella TaxID=2447956 RepID=A0A4S4MXA6_9APHY|nr:hypothetical protein EUX98_g6135 [Antrodiella citrinella]